MATISRRLLAGIAAIGFTLGAGTVWAQSAGAEPTVQYQLSDEGEAATDKSEPAVEATPVGSVQHASDCGCSGKACSCAEMAAVRKAVAGSHKPLFYNNRFDYLCDPCYDEWWPGDRLKRNAIGDWGVLDVGGQYRARFHDEINMRGLGLTGRDDQFLLHRTRLYANLEVGTRLRFFAEYLDAVSNYENFAPRPIEESRSNMQNLFADALLWEGMRGSVTARVGRQELLYGDQRLISPLDWSNTRRTFDGVTVMWQGENWDVDGFWSYPVSPTGKGFLNADRSQEFSGLWATYKGFESETLDFFYLRYIETEGSVFEYNTAGAAYRGSSGNFLWDFWGAYQWGDVANVDQEAFAWTAGLGYKFACQWGSPTVWAFYDWAEGDANGNGFHHLFPLGHKYLGWMDLFGRRNIEDLNFLATMTPHEKWKLFAWWHVFWLQDGNDVPYSVVMTPYVGAPGGSQYLGQELDLIADWKINPRMDLLFGYSHFFAGTFYRTNPGALYSDDADFFYLQFTFNF